MGAPERDARLLIVAHFVANISIGISLLLWANLSAESVMQYLVPPWFWPSMFMTAGAFAFVGIWSRVMAQFAFIFAAIITGIFGVASLYAVVINGVLAAIPTTVFLFYITLLKLALSRAIQQRAEILQQVAESTKKGQSALDGAGHGSAA